MNTTGTLCNMIEVAFTLGCLAAGLETNFKPDPEEHLFAHDPYADLERAYGARTLSDWTAPEGRTVGINELAR